MAPNQSNGNYKHTKFERNWSNVQVQASISLHTKFERNWPLDFQVQAHTSVLFPSPKLCHLVQQPWRTVFQQALMFQ